MAPIPGGYDHLVEAFKKRFNAAPALVVRCPGRVNLIGEHIDYSGYSVLPMAIKQATFVLARLNGTTKINLINTNPTTYPDYEHDTSVPWDGTKSPKWHHYFLCGWKGGVQELISSNKAPKSLGIDILVDGSVPPNAGLSSSSSVVCAALLTTLAVHLHLDTTRIDRRGIADLAARVEHYIGVEGGGMDQAIECLAEEGHALRIDFNPLRSTRLVLPSRAVFAVLHSGATMNKGATDYYNQRVVECRIAAQIIAKRLSHCNWREVRTLKHLAEFLSKDADEMIAVIDRHFEDDLVTREEVLHELETSDIDFAEYSLNDSTADSKFFSLLAWA
uniref:Galactokinase n=1 Tax=Panagrellus redivivus TaxID=6233 RepID=A0A7E4ZYN8_PANRE